MEGVVYRKMISTNVGAQMNFMTKTVKRKMSVTLILVYMDHAQIICKIIVVSVNLVLLESTVTLILMNVSPILVSMVVVQTTSTAIAANVKLATMESTVTLILMNVSPILVSMVAVQTR